MSEKHLKFVTPCQSFIDTSFFQELARLKIDVLKLDSSIKELSSFLDVDQIPKGSPCAPLLFNSQSFTEVYDNRLSMKGYLFNFNTIEEFKNLDKTEFLRQRANELWEEGLEDPNRSVKFSLISFADLKASLQIFLLGLCTLFSNSIANPY